LTSDVAPDAVREALRDVMDPEFPVSVVDLGLIRRIDVEGTSVRIGLTYTSLGCPCADLIKEDVRARVLSLPGVEKVDVEEVFDRWSRSDISTDGLRLLRVVGTV
jgi:metal-sulfur cluster biosynthetic enzyme